MNRYYYPRRHPQTTLLSPVADDESKYDESLATPNEITSGGDGSDHARPQQQQQQQPHPQEYTQQQQRQQHGRMVEQGNHLVDSHQQQQQSVNPSTSSGGAQRALRRKATKYFHKTTAHPESRSSNNKINTNQRTNIVNVPTTTTKQQYPIMSTTHKSTMINASSPNSLDTPTTMELSTTTTNESPISPITRAPASTTRTAATRIVASKSNNPSRSMPTTTMTSSRTTDVANPSSPSLLLLQQEFLLQHEYQQQELLYHKQRQEQREQQQQHYQQEHYSMKNGHCVSSLPGDINSTTTTTPSQTQQLSTDDTTMSPKDARRLLWDKNACLITKKLPLKPPSLYGCHTTTTTATVDDTGAQVTTTADIAPSINNNNNNSNKHDNTSHERYEYDNNFQPHWTLCLPQPKPLTIPTLNNYEQEDYNNNIDDPPLQYYESRSNVSGYSSAGSDLENAARRILLSRSKKNVVVGGGGGGRSWSAERLGGSHYRLSGGGSDSECSVMSVTGLPTTTGRRDYITNINGINNRERVQQRTSLPTGWRERIHRKTGREVPKMAKSTATMLAAKKMKDDSNIYSTMTTTMQHQHAGAVENPIRGSRDVSSNEVVKPSHHQPPPPPPPSMVASLAAAAAAAQSWSRPVVLNPSPVVTKSSYSNVGIGNIISDQTICNQTGNIDQKQQHQRRQQQQLITYPISSQNTELDESMYHFDDLQKGGIFPNYHRFCSQSLEDSIDRVSDFSPPFPTNGNNIDDSIIINQYGFPRYCDSTKYNEMFEGKTSCTEDGEVLPLDSKQRRSVRFTIPAKNIQHEGGGRRDGGERRRGDGESNNNTGDGSQYAKQPHQQQQQHQTQRENYEDNTAGNPAATNGNDHVGHGNWEEIQSLTVDWKRAISPERKNYSMDEFSTLQTSSEMDLFAWDDDIRDYNREMSQGNNNPDSPSRPLWKMRKDAKNDRQRTLSELQVEYNDAKEKELLSQSPLLHHKQNFQRGQQDDSAYSRWNDSQFATSSGVDLPPQVRRMPDTFDVISGREELHVRKSRSRMTLDLRSSSREKRWKDAVIMPTGKSTNGVECKPYYFTDGDVPDREHDTPGSPSSWKRFGLFRSKSLKRRQYYSDGERFNSDRRKTTTKKKKTKKKPPTSLVASPPRSLSRVRSPMRMRGQKDNSNVITDNKEFILMNDSMSMGGKHDNVSKIVDMTTGGEMGVETIAQWNEVESQIQEPPIFEDEEPNTPISELNSISNMSIVPSTSVVQSNDLRDNHPRALAANANHTDIPRLMSQHYDTSLLDDTCNTSGFDKARFVVSFDADALGSLDTSMATLPSTSMALAASARSPRSIRSRDASNAYISDGNTTLTELNEIERLRRENEILTEELENVSQLTMKVSKMYTECLKLENVRLRVSKEYLISQEVAASESIIHKLDVIAEEIDKTNTLKEGRKKKKKHARKLRVRHTPNPTVINEFNNLLPVAHLINGVDFDDDTVTTVSTQGGYETTPELLKRTCSSIVATTAILASQVKSSLNQQSDSSASRPMDCFNHCRRKTDNDNFAEASIARKKTYMTK